MWVELSPTVLGLSYSVKVSGIPAWKPRVRFSLTAESDIISAMTKSPLVGGLSNW